MSNPPPLGFQSPQHQANSAFLAKWGKRFLILWLAFVGFALMILLLIFLLVGSCAVKTVSEVGRLQNEAARASRERLSKVTSEAGLNAHRTEIERQLEERKEQSPRPSNSQNIDLDQLRKPINGGADFFARSIAERAVENANNAGREAMKKHEERKRSSYQGFPGHYDAKKQ